MALIYRGAFCLSAVKSFLDANRTRSLPVLTSCGVGSVASSGSTHCQPTPQSFEYVEKLTLTGLSIRSAGGGSGVGRGVGTIVVSTGREHDNKINAVDRDRKHATR